MNFLAHAFLSGENKDFIIGNFIADSVKGKKYLNYRHGIANGILLHRKIDTFTDRHPDVSIAKIHLYRHFGKYSSIVCDIYFDHFLALYWEDYSIEPLLSYTERIYSIIKEELDGLPEEVKYFFPSMMKHNWLYNYKNFNGLERTFDGMSRRTQFSSNMDKAVEVLKEEHYFFEGIFRQFFPLLMEYSSKERNVLEQ